MYVSSSEERLGSGGGAGGNTGMKYERDAASINSVVPTVIPLAIAVVAMRSVREA